MDPGGSWQNPALSDARPEVERREAALLSLRPMGLQQKGWISRVGVASKAQARRGHKGGRLVGLRESKPECWRARPRAAEWSPAPLFIHTASYDPLHTPEWAHGHA